MRRRDVIRKLVFPAVGVFAAPCFVAAQTPLQQVRVVCTFTEDITDVYYAIKTGLFAKAGLGVEMISTTSGAAGVAAVLSGTYEIARTSFISLFSAHLRKIPIVLVAPEVIYTPQTPSALLLMAADSTYKTGADLNGKTIGVPSLGDLSTLGAKAWVDRNGGDWRSLKFVEIPNSAEEAALVAHRVDAAMVQPPQLDTALEARTVKRLADAYGAIAPTFMTAGFVAHADWVVAHPETVRKWVAALATATAYVNTHHAETAPFVSELTKIPLADTTKLHRVLNATTLEPGLIQPFIDAAARYELIPRTFPARELLGGAGGSS